jgi:hypothetical protein
MPCSGGLAKNRLLIPCTNPTVSTVSYQRDQPNSEEKADINNLNGTQTVTQTSLNAPNVSFSLSSAPGFVEFEKDFPIHTLFEKMFGIEVEGASAWVVPENLTIISLPLNGILFHISSSGGYQSEVARALDSLDSLEDKNAYSDVFRDGIEMKTIALTTAGTVLSARTEMVFYIPKDVNFTRDSFKYQINNGTVVSNIAKVNIVAGVSPGASITTTGEKGVYLVPIVVGTAAGIFTCHCNAITVPDRFQILFSTNDKEDGNELKNMSIVADSLFVGDGVGESRYDPLQGSDRAIYKDLDLFTYTGTQFIKTGTETVNLTEADICAVSSVKRNTRNLNFMGGLSRAGGNRQFGVRSSVFTSTSDTVGRSDLNQHDGNIGIYFVKPETKNTFLAYLKVTGVSNSTAWGLYKIVSNDLDVSGPW